MSARRDPHGGGEASPRRELIDAARTFETVVEHWIQQPDNTDEVDIAITEAFNRAVESLIAHKIGEMTAQEFFDLYERVSGTEATSATLAGFEALKEAQLQRELRLAEIAQEVKLSALFRLERLDKGEVVTIGLFNRHSHIEHDADWEGLEGWNSWRTLTLRMLEPAEGYSEVIANEFTGPSETGPRAAVYTQVGYRSMARLLEPHERGKIGTLILGPDGEVMEPTLTLKTSMGYMFGADQAPIEPDEVVGYVSTLDGTLLMDGSEG